ncbi:hypothetical protein GCM10011533_37480 [Streptosporangium jomthongense]|uniref:Riboflavin synthase n=1 Tax=Marinobacter aromaticivorans TaxID=1494078 RepID=A0ABW2J0X6_9GAMM|nr:hypothetical protein GCM10011533_37480 [Streptosporangium jomthongense]
MIQEVLLEGVCGDVVEGGANVLNRETGRNSKLGDTVNVEFDILARYVARLQSRG